MPEQMFQSDFVSRADAVTNRHINHVTQATAALNSVMASLKQTASVSVPAIANIPAPNEPAAVNLAPQVDLAAVFRDDTAGKFAELKKWFADLQNGASGALFPNPEGALGPEADAWLLKAIRGEAVRLEEDAEMARGRARAWEEAQRARRAAAGNLAALGYPMPPGALVAASQEADFAAARAVSELNRDLTIRAAELRIETVKFAAAQVQQIRQFAAGALTSYLGVFTRLHADAASFAAAKAEAQEKLWAAGSRYYAAQLSFKNLAADVSKANQQAGTAAAQLRVAVDDKQIERDLKSLQVAAEVYGRLVAGAMSGINSHISLGASSNAGTNYNLSGTYP